MTILITGGAGYIGSHTFYAFKETGHDVVVVDNLSTGHRALLPMDISFYQGNVADDALMDKIFTAHKIDAVIHFAGSIIVADSVAQPIDYFENNTVASLSLLKSCVKHGIKNFIFSSTASVYGSNPAQVMKEDFATHPENPYADSKLMTEMMLKDISAAHGLNYIILRYFNVAGADAQGRTGQVSKVASHLIKIAAEVITGKRENIKIMGTDYPTEDGTCVRDYIHVTDLANAHLKAFEALTSGVTNRIFNCGYGRGFTVRQVLATVEKVSGKTIQKIDAPRRGGDPVALIADSTLLRQVTGWTPKLDNLDVIVRSALEWEKNLAQNIKKAV